jgi:hypothetical protein
MKHGVIVTGVPLGRESSGKQQCYEHSTTKNISRRGHNLITASTTPFNSREFRQNWEEDLLVPGLPPLRDTYLTGALGGFGVGTRESDVQIMRDLRACP